MKLKRTQGDKWFSDCIRMSVNWVCECCGTDYSHKPQALDCSHFYSRANYSLRFFPMNAFAHCMGCHSKLGGNPALFMKFVTRELGAHGVSMLESLSNDVDLGRAARKADKNGEISLHYRTEFREMEAERKKGNASKIIFRGWIPDYVDEEIAQRWALESIT